MENKKGKMDREERARQFMPFDALYGLREALEEKEKVAESEGKIGKEVNSFEKSKRKKA